MNVLAEMTEFVVRFVMAVVLSVLAWVGIVIDEFAQQEAQIVWARMVVTVEGVLSAYYTRDKAWFPLAKLRYKNHNTLHTCLKLYIVGVYFDESGGI